MRDIARRLGVNHSTISLALRNSPRISVEMRGRVQAVAQEMGYRPDPSLSALQHYRHRRTSTRVAAALGWLNFWPKPEKMRATPLFNAIRAGATEAAELLGYHIEEFCCGDGVITAQQLKKILRARGIRGLLLPPQRPPILKSDFAFDWEDFAIIRIGRTVLYPPAHVVTSSQAHDALMAFRHIWKKGYRRIGLATATTIHTYGLFDAGFLKAQSEVPRKDHIPTLVLNERPQASLDVLKRIDSWMKHNRPDAILTTEGNMKSLLSAAGYQVPDDVALAATSISICDVDAGILENGEEIGRVAIQTLNGLLYRNEFGLPETLQDILVRGVWKDGTSLPDRPKS